MQKSWTCCRRDIVIDTPGQLECCEILDAVENGHDSDDELPGGQPSRALGENWGGLAGDCERTDGVQELKDILFNN